MTGEANAITRERLRTHYERAGISHNFLTNWLIRHRTRALMLDNRWTLTCGYGFWHTGRALSIGLRIKWLRLKLLASAPPLPGGQVKSSVCQRHPGDVIGKGRS